MANKVGKQIILANGSIDDNFIDVIRGTNQGDLIDAFGGDDKIFAGDGTNIIFGGNGKDQIHGGAGQDTIVPNTHAHSVLGAWGHDVVEGGLGTDTISYRLSTDGVTIWGDDHKDLSVGVRDIINGSQGADRIFGGGGNDDIDGESGFDEIHGNSGRDNIHGGEGFDQLFGGSDRDTIHGDAGGDTIHGNSGADKLFGDDGRDFIKGGSGDDLIVGGRDADILWGGSGADTFRYADNTRFATDSSVQNADIIMDFNASTKTHPDVWDRLDLEVEGSNRNFERVEIDFVRSNDGVENSKAALDAANAAHMTHGLFGINSEVKYEFVTNGHDGWLFAELDSTHRGFDTAIHLEGVTDLTWHNII